MKLINHNFYRLIFKAYLIAFFSTLFSYSQSKDCTFDKVIENTILEEVEYKKIENYINLENTLKEKKKDFIGYIGDKKKRLTIHFNSIKIDSIDGNCYLVEGYSIVQKNIRKFKGYFELEDHFQLNDTFYDDSREYGFSSFKFSFHENRELTSTGVFKGKFLILWSKNNTSTIEYDDIFDGYDGGRNYQFIGEWISFKTGKPSIVAWGQYRIPCAGDLDIGAAEFMPNPKYFKYGWENYKP